MLTNRCLALASKQQRPCLGILGRRSYNDVYSLIPSLTFYRLKHAKSNVEDGEEVKPERRKRKPSADKKPVLDHVSTTPSSPAPNLTLSQLQDLARTLGISQTAPKSALVARLQDTLKHHSPPPATARILSIDLGIRNLAYALLSPSPSSSPGTITKPVVHAWNRVDLRSLSTSTSTPLKQDFSPPSLSQLALSLVQTHFLPLNPTHVLIEKQRFRSGGGSAVLEWTVRVNSLESMLYAVFATLKSLDAWEGVVEAVDPKRVGPFMLEDEGVVNEEKEKEEGNMRGKKKGGKENKRLKIDLVGGWIRDGRGVVFEGEGEVMRRGFLRRWLPKERKVKVKVKKTKGKDKDEEVEEVKEEEVVLVEEEGDERIPKLDDVADCLLQGVAWLRWGESKRRLAKELGDKLKL